MDTWVIIIVGLLGVAAAAVLLELWRALRLRMGLRATMPILAKLVIVSATLIHVSIPSRPLWTWAAYLGVTIPALVVLNLDHK